MDQGLNAMRDHDAELLGLFLDAENSPGLHAFLAGLTGRHGDGAGAARQAINLNMFDLVIDHSTGMVSIEEVISPCRDVVMPLADFLALLKADPRC